MRSVGVDVLVVVMAAAAADAGLRGDARWSNAVDLREPCEGMLKSMFQDMMRMTVSLGSRAALGEFAGRGAHRDREGT